MATTPPVPVGTPARRPTAPDAARTWTVRPGDDLWSIAARIVGTAPAGADRSAVAAYWVRIIEANRSTLPDPGDPSLLFPGDVIHLPPL